MGLTIEGVDLGLSLPSFSTAGIGYWVTWGAIIFLLTFLVCIGIWLWYQNKLYNKKIIVFENIAGQGYQPAIKDTARMIKVGDGGEELLFLRKKKCFRTAYGKKMGKNTYWFAIGQDGYWYNILLGDLDAKMGMLDIEPIDRDMRYMHVAIRKNIQERYRKEKFMDKYGAYVFQGFFILIMVIACWLLMSKAGDLIESATVVTKSIEPLVNALLQAISKLDTLCSSSGLSST